MTTITWTITALNCKPSEGQYTDVVITAHWTCAGQDGEHSASVYSTCSFSQPEGQFTPYDQLTQEQVLGWCWASGVDKEATEAAVQQQIDNQVNPPVTQPPLPWAA
ncbi:MAG: Synechococcus phage [Pseudomonadota bacterium]|jgi:hypothetical protein